ncbi:hypothetical protein F5887DRAFT_931881 [Amanita rubescens]|nr:hypothetical protein F5887DRAFT_931881 [Amanita rubescens]
MSESPESDKLSKGWKTGRHLVMFTEDTTRCNGWNPVTMSAIDHPSIRFLSASVRFRSASIRRAGIRRSTSDAREYVGLCRTTSACAGYNPEHIAVFHRGDIENKLERLCKVLWAPKGVENCFEDLKCFVGKFDDKSLEILRSNLDGPSKDRIVELIHEEYIFPARRDDVPWGVARLTSPKQLPGGTGSSTFKSFLDPNSGKGVDIYVISLNHLLNVYAGESNSNQASLLATTFDGKTPLIKSDFNGHGTHVVGIAAGKKYGVAKAARIIAIKVLGTAPWAYDFPADIRLTDKTFQNAKQLTCCERYAEGVATGTGRMAGFEMPFHLKPLDRHAVSQ